MNYQLTRRALDAAAYSDRTAKIGKPMDSLSQALRLALDAAAKDGPVTVTHARTGRCAIVGHVRYANGPHAGADHVTVSLPREWLDQVMRAVPLEA